MNDSISRQAAIDAIASYNGVVDKSVAKRILIQLPPAPLPKGEWLRMSDLSEKDDNRYKCSHCGNVIHHKSRMDLYTFNSWCGRCGSDNRSGG